MSESRETRFRCLVEDELRCLAREDLPPGLDDKIFSALVKAILEGPRWLPPDRYIAPTEKRTSMVVNDALVLPMRTHAQTALASLVFGHEQMMLVNWFSDFRASMGKAEYPDLTVVVSLHLLKQCFFVLSPNYSRDNVHSINYHIKELLATYDYILINWPLIPRKSLKLNQDFFMSDKDSTFMEEFLDSAEKRYFMALENIYDMSLKNTNKFSYFWLILGQKFACEDFGRLVAESVPKCPSALNHLIECAKLVPQTEASGLPLIQVLRKLPPVDNIDDTNNAINEILHKFGHAERGLYDVVQRGLALHSVTSQATIQSQDRPCWDNKKLILSFRGKSKTYKAGARNQALLLNAFEECQWPDMIPDPLPGPRESSSKKLNDTIKDLNKSIKGNLDLHFSTRGANVFWKHTEP
jgi:hypothetical protein